MLDRFGNWLGGIKQVMKLSSDKNFRKLMQNPGMRVLLKDREFQEAVEKKDFQKMMANPKFSELLQDADFQDLIQNINLSQAKSD